MKVEMLEEALCRLRESRDFIELARLGHELTEGSLDGGAEREAPVEASFRCASCGDLIRFRDLAWGVAPQPVWVLAEMSGDPDVDCQARRLEYQRLSQDRALQRWKRLRWTAAGQEYFKL